MVPIVDVECLKKCSASAYGAGGPGGPGGPGGLQLPLSEKN